ncbi:PAS domain-containing protein [Prosthecobacter sp.]|uniref:PAS domain-containing protein n=1 Tax=Prosthecobacter sp. TaxID=1965333 RepID=UPI0024896A63|nr:PAS domain-containing protein [Prosthecobacter sp.]MDI1313276.1 PAS domain-containing protein [Prosthecobacter sp.]
MEEAFPFLFTWNRRMRIMHAGPSLARIAPDVSAGSRLERLFKLERPQGMLNAEWLDKHCGELLLLRHHGTGMLMRGQVMHLEDSGLNVFLGAPWLNTSDELDRLGLTLADFAPHDSAQDLLDVVQGHRIANEELRKLAMVAQRTDNAVILADKDGLIEWVNDAFERMTGWTLNEVRGLKPGSFLQGQRTDPHVASDMGRKVRAGEGFRTVILNYHKDGAPYWVDIEVQPIHDTQGSLTHFMAIQADVSGSKRNEMRRQLEATAAEVISSGVEMTEIIPTMLAALGSQLQSSLGNWWVRGITGETLQLANTWQQEGGHVKPLMQTSQDICFAVGKGLPGWVWATRTSHWITDVRQDENFLHGLAAVECGITGAIAIPVHVDGQMCGVLEFFSQNLDAPDADLLNGLNHIGRLLGLLLKRLEAEEALRKSERAMNEGQKLAHIGTWEWDLHTNMLAWSDEIFRIYGYVPRSFTPTMDHVRKSVLAEDIPRLLEVLDSVARTGVSQELSYRVTRPDGEIRHVHTLVAAEYDVGSVPCRVVGTMQDVTERILMAKACEHSQRISHLGNWTVDLVDGSLSWSAEQCRIYGFEPGSVEVSLELFRRAIHPEDVDSVMQFVDSVAKTGEATTINYRIIRPDGDVRHLRSSAEGSRDSCGNIRTIIGTVHDITELAEAQRTLQQTDERWQVALQNNGLGVWDWNIISGSVIYTDALQQMLGYEAGEWPQHVDSWSSRVHPDDLAFVMETLNQYLRGETPDYRCEHRLSCKDGSWKWVQDVACIVSRTKEGLPQRMIGTQMDIHNRKQSEKAVKRRAELLNGIRSAQEHFIGTTEVGPVFTEMLDVIVRHTCSSFGFIAEVLKDEQDQPYLRSYSLTDISWDEATRSFMQSVGPVGLEFRNLKTLFGAALVTREVVIANDAAKDPRSGGLPPGHPPIHSFLGLPIYNGLEMVGLIGLANRPEVYDKESIKELDPFLAAVSSMIVARREAQRRRQIEEELRAARDKAEAASRAKNEFLAMISHEIRTPMNGVIGMAGLLQTSQLDAKQSEMVNAVLHSGHALIKIIDDILNFAKIEAGQIELCEQPLVVDELIEGVVDLLHNEAATKGLELAAIIDSELPEAIRGDAGRLRQVLLNLAGNAVKFTDKGHVTIRVAGVDGQVEFRVEDSGIGLSDSDHERLFKPFSQLDISQSRRFSGTGLGLAICKKLVDGMNGRIGVESVVGRGSQFWFRVPLHGAQNTQVARQSMTRQVFIAHTSPAMRECIRNALAAPGVEFHELKRTQVRRHLAASHAADEVLVLDVAWIPAAQTKQSCINWRQVVIIGSAVITGRAAPAEASFVTLPLHRQALRTAVWPAALASRPKSALPHRRTLGLNVLVAEDNRINARLACLLLENLGCKAVVAINGMEAVAAYKKQRFDVVLMDCQMPIMDGYAATRKIRQLETKCGNRTRVHCKIIAMTANALPEERERCIASGMDEHLSKPFTPESLEQLLNASVRAEGLEAAPVADPLAVLAAQIGEDETRKLADIWLEEAPSRHQQLTAALKRGQLEACRKEAHALRGASSIFGMRALVEICLELETTIEKGRRVTAVLHKTFGAHLEQATASLLQARMKRSI